MLRLFCFVFVFFGFTEAAVLQSLFVLRYACAPTTTRSYHCLRPFLFFVSSFFFFFGDVAFSEYFCAIITVFSLYGEYVVPGTFFLPDDVFLPCDHVLDFLHRLM